MAEPGPRLPCPLYARSSPLRLVARLGCLPALSSTAPWSPCVQAICWPRANSSAWPVVVLGPSSFCSSLPHSIISSSRLDVSPYVTSLTYIHADKRIPRKCREASLWSMFKWSTKGQNKNQHRLCGVILNMKRFQELWMEEKVKLHSILVSCSIEDFNRRLSSFPPTLNQVITVSQITIFTMDFMIVK
jgi:hypothetical protein